MLVQPANDRAQVGATNRLAPLADVARVDLQRFVFLSPKSVPDSYTRGSVSSFLEEEAMRTVRWGVLSTANIATQKVIPGLRKARSSELLAIASRDANRARSAADELGIARAYGSYEALLADSDVDAVYIPLPNHLHARWTIEAARPASTCCARSRWR
jgi:hypothetical protein